MKEEREKEMEVRERELGGEREREIKRVDEKER